MAISGKLVRWSVAATAVVVGLVSAGIASRGSAWFWGGLFALAVTALAVWSGKMLFGPHFFYDLLRLARRARTRDVRVLYGVALLVGLGLVYWIQFPRQGFQGLLFEASARMSINDVARFAEVFVFTVIVVQNLTVLLLTPVYVGSAIAEERESKTLDLLFTTQMKDHEILLGKLFARLAHLGAILLGGLPVLSLAQLWGGIDFRVLVANFVNTAFNLLSVGAVSILVSAMCKRVVTAVMIIYGLVIPITFCLGILSLGGRTSILGLSQSDMGDNPEMMLVVLGGLGVFHLLVTISSVSVALVIMRGLHGAEDFLVGIPPPPPPPRRLKRKPAFMEEREPSLVVDRLYDLPPVHNDPLFWKEMHLGLNWPVLAPLFYTGLGLSLAIVVMGFLVMAGVERQNWSERTHGLGQAVRVLCILWSLICCLAVAFTSASAVVRERQQASLEGLLMLPISRNEILWTKWLGCLFRPWAWWTCFTAVVLAGTAVTALHISAGFFVLAAGFIHGAFFASLGIFLSVTSKKVLSAHGKLVLALVLVFFASWLYTEITRESTVGVYSEFLRVGLNPVLTWWTLGFSYRDFQNLETLNKELGGALLGLALYAFLALFFWLLACWRFAREKNWRPE